MERAGSHLQLCSLLKPTSSNPALCTALTMSHQTVWVWGILFNKSPAPCTSNSGKSLSFLSLTVMMHWFSWLLCYLHFFPLAATSMQKILFHISLSYGYPNRWGHCKKKCLFEFHPGLLENGIFYLIVVCCCLLRVGLMCSLLRTCKNMREKTIHA